MATGAKKVQRKSKVTGKRTAHSKKWSASVTAHSDALDLENSVFKSDSAKEIAASLKCSANKSYRRKGTPFQSAMSMLNFYINRAGSNLPEKQKHTLEEAKDELRKLFDRPVKGEEKK